MNEKIRKRPVDPEHRLLAALLPVVLLVPVIAGSLFVLGQLPAVPYNIREVLGGEPRLVVALGASCALLFAAGPQALLGVVTVRDRFIVGAVMALLVHAVLVYGALRMVVPLESIEDIVGSPVLGWHPELERGLRFAALFGGVSVVLMGAAGFLYAALYARGFTAFGRWLAVAVTLLPLVHWVVVSAAATDNLVELMAGGGTLFSSLMLALGLFCAALAASFVSARAAGYVDGWAAAMILVALSVPVSYVLVLLGTNSHIEKYGAEFSALQFLLSANRDNYLSGSDLIGRFAIAHLAAVGLLAVAQLPFWRWLALGPTRV